MDTSMINGIIDKFLAPDDDSLDSKFEMNLLVLVDTSLDEQIVLYAKEALLAHDEGINMHVEPFYSDPVEPSDTVDLAIVLANESPWVGATVHMAEANGVKTVVLAESLEAVVSHSERTGFPLNYENVIAREALDEKFVMVPGIVGKAIDMVAPLVGIKQKKAGLDEMFSALAAWVMRHCPEERNLFAKAFVFARPEKVNYMVRSTAYQNAVVAALFFTPGADFPVMTLNQIKMLINIEREYGFGLEKQTIFEALAVAAIALSSRTVVRKICSSVPLISWFVKVFTGYLVTLAMGYLIKEYCEAGRALPECCPIKGCLSVVEEGIKKPSFVVDLTKKAKRKLND